MSSLLALILVTQNEHTSPTLTFAWPPRPRPIPRLDRPVYKPAQSRAGGVDTITFTEPKSRSRSCLPKEDPSVLHYVRGFKKDGGSSEDELDLFYEPPQPTSRHFTQRVTSGGSLAGSFVRRRGTLMSEGAGGEQDEDPSICPGSFYWASAKDLDPIPEDNTDQFLGFERDEWADMLTTRLPSDTKDLEGTKRGARTGRKLELVIDSLAIIGHPVVISQKLSISHNDASFERGRTRTRSGEQVVSDRQESVNSSCCDASLVSTDNTRNYSSSRERSRVTDLSAMPHTSTTPASSQVIMSHSKLLAKPLILDNIARPLPILSPSPSRPPAGPVSQLTRMMTPSIPSHLDSPPPVSLYNPASRSSIRSASSPSPTPAQRVTYQSFLGTSLNRTRSLLAYSPLDSSRSMVTPAPESADDLMLASTRLVPLQSFTLALIIDTPPASHLSEHLEVYYQDVVLKLTAALKRLERQSSYLTRESQKINRVEHHRRESDSHRSMSKSKKTSTEEMMRLIERHSDLARALAQVFDDLKDLGRTSVTFDDQLDLELLLHRELFDNQSGPENWLTSTGSPDECGEQDKYLHLESWKGLLLLEEPKVLIELAPPQSLLRHFIAAIKPALTLSEYTSLLDTDSGTIAEMAEHLIYWRKARMTDVVTLRNTYQLSPLIHPHSDLSSDQDQPARLPLATLSEEFSDTFPNLPHLVSVLSLISKCARQPFASILPALKPGLDKGEPMTVLVWLLTQNLICRERTHVRLKVDAQTKLKVKRMDRYQTKRSEEDFNAHDELGSLSPESQMRLSRHEPSTSTSPAARPTSVQSSLGPARASAPKASSPLVHTTSTRSLSTLQRHQTQATISSLPPSTIRSTSDYSASNLSAQFIHRLEPGSSDSMPSSNEFSRRRRRRMRQLSVQSGFSGQSEENGRAEELEEATFEIDEEDEILGEPGKATALQRRWLDELCAGKPEAIITSFNLVLRYFNGRYPLEEIISRSGLTRRALNEVLTEFESNLTLLVHP
ncbi:hypothetical protein CROQUDRAFT_671474 [Cronartium quercuum f. sp. fusiforme G11]|uniref:Nitrogen permease regulator 3 n=1 Tax=Cronartium quercuum f. sp. fusiforme G11 TaxID=708437 RepID=A0A9P6NKJ0_9BASI|nr:hypothetical protein CROQUDRAFT_671474 [Cronartium quercuum f. sp. fusiforme G11]